MHLFVRAVIVLALLIAVGVGVVKARDHLRVTRELARQESVIAAARAPILAALKDPLSAQWRNESIKRNGKTVCGELNSKNSMGGYVGFKRYLSNSALYLLDDGTFSTWPTEDAGRDVPQEIKTAARLAGDYSTNATMREIFKESVFAWYWRELCAA